MFYVGTCSSFSNKKTAQDSRVSILEKLGHSRGRAERFLNDHPPVEINGKLHRAAVFCLPEGFRGLNNAFIKTAIKLYKCTWIEAKFHIYRETARDIIVNRAQWADLLPKEGDTAPPEEPVSPTAALDTNQVVAPVASLVP